MTERFVHPFGARVREGRAPADRPWAAYTRVSTIAQDLRPQELAIAQYAEARQVPVTWYHDVGTGRAGADGRPGLRHLLEDIRRRRVGGLIVWRFDRLARSTRQLLQYLELCRVTGTSFVSLTEAIDTTTPIGELIYTFLAAVAQFEAELIRERVRAGLAAARARGQRLGRPPKRLGYREQEALVEAWQALGSVRAVARRLGLSRRQVLRHLRGAGIPVHLREASGGDRDAREGRAGTGPEPSDSGPAGALGTAAAGPHPEGR